MDRSIVAIGIGIGTAALFAATALHSAALPPPAEALRIEGLSADRAAIVEHAIELFDDADLPLPAVTVALGDGQPSCAGPSLAFHRQHEDRSQIFLCYPEIAGRELRVISHELAHAWATIGLTDERRRAFQALRGWDHWRDYDRATWSENGTEQAAEIIKWGVGDEPTPVFMDDDSCAQLREGYRVLTGKEPPHGLTDLCDG